MLPNQTVWPVNFGLTGPICARAINLLIPLKLSSRGHHDWPVKRRYRKLTRELGSTVLSFRLRDYATTGLVQQTLQRLSRVIGLDVGGERARATRNAALLSG